MKEDLISVVLYGSTARGEITENSDIDLLVISKGLPSEYHDRVEALFPVIRELYQGDDFQSLKAEGIFPKIEYLILDVSEAQGTNNLDFDLLTDAKILYDTGFFAEKMAILGKKLKRLGAKKVILDKKNWYWDLKPDLKPGEVIEI